MITLKIGETYMARIPNADAVGGVAKMQSAMKTAFGKCVYIHPSGRWCVLEFDGWRQCFFAEDLQK